MSRFAERTGLTSERPQRRYLWTDAFAVCNFLGLGRATGERRYDELALRLVDRVHHALGRHRGDDGRAGWLSGLSEKQGELHPTRGGLRIGKTLPERRADEPFDERLEWDRDGQYFHYLTKWMHALDQAARGSGQPLFNVWARELLEVACLAFRAPIRGGPPRLVWKMSIDLTRPLVASSGHHDPLDGLITCAQLRATAGALPGSPREPALDRELADLGAMVESKDWATADPLGLGGLLVDACRVERLAREGAFSGGRLLDALLAAALEGLTEYARQGDDRQPASRRLAFRELGLALGLAAIARLEAPDLRPFLPLGEAIESFWLDPGHRSVRTWTEHQDINDVMLATCLVPDGFIEAASRGGGS